MKIRLKNIMVLIALMLIVSACAKKDSYIAPKEGDIVVWKQSDEFVIRARLGRQRKHIPDEGCPRCEGAFYSPRWEWFLGQFPIDYVPEKLPPITKNELAAMKYPWKIGFNNQGIEFYLVLNGAKVDATDNTFFRDSNEQGKKSIFDDRYQVRVSIESFGRSSRDGLKLLKKNNFILPNWIKESVFYKDGLACFYYNKDDIGSDRGYACQGQTVNKRVDSFKISQGHDETTGEYNLINKYSKNSLYYEACEKNGIEEGGQICGLSIEWKTDRRNFNEWKKIDAAIWRLLNAWNIAPVLKKSEGDLK